MKNIFASILLIALANICAAQTPVDFNAKDCNNVSYNLFTELNNGKVVVLVWVEPCVGCNDGSKTADSIVRSFGFPHPDKVLLWFVDDGPPSVCSDLLNWATAMGISGDKSNAKFFGNYDNEIDQNIYGGLGMPHIVVIGPDHHVYYNELNGIGTNLDYWILHAINGTAGIPGNNNKALFTVSPNPVNEMLSVNNVKPIKSISIISVSGDQLIHEDVSYGKMTTSVNTSELARGIYLIKVTDFDGNTSMQKVLK